MSFPKDFDEMRSFGYKFDGDGICRGCGEDIMWFTTPRGKKIPMNHMERGSDLAIAHWSTCSDAPLFRKEQ